MLDIKFLLYYIKPYLSFTKKFLLVGMTFSVVLILFSYFWKIDAPISKTPDPRIENRKQLYELINNKDVNKTTEGRIYISAVRSIMCGVIGEGCSNNPADGDKNVKSSLLGSVTNLAMLPLENPPASGVQTVYMALQHTGFVPNTYAAMGIGYAALTPFRQIWTLCRNLVFLFMVIIIIAIGFMIMFRTKINAQTVVSLENSLPKIALTLIFITFSFAIAGFMIDLMYVSLFFLAGIFTQPDLDKKDLLQNTNNIMSQLMYGKNGGPFGFMFDGAAIANVASGFYQFIPGQVRTILDQIVGAFGYNIVLKGVSKVAPAVFGAAIPVGAANPGVVKTASSTLGASKTLGGLLKTLYGFMPWVKTATGSGTPFVGIITGVLLLLGEGMLAGVLAPFVTSLAIFLVLMASLLLVYFRIIFMLIKEYIQVLVQVMFAPVFIASEIIPGQKGFSTWLKNLFIHLLTFPILFLVLLVSKTIISAPVERSPLWQPPFIWGFDAEAFKYIVGAAFLFMAPEFVNMFKEMTGIKPSDLKMNFGAFFASGMLLGKTAFGAPGRFSSVRNLAESFGSDDAKEQRQKYFSNLPPIFRRLFYGNDPHTETH